jgi:hypothetical protein
VPGGVGLSERLFERHDELVAGRGRPDRGCGCESGCPACTGPRLEPDVDAKALALRLLRALVADGRRTAAPGGGRLSVDGTRLQRRVDGARLGASEATDAPRRRAGRARTVGRGGPGHPPRDRRRRCRRRFVRAAAAGLAGRGPVDPAALARRLAAAWTATRSRRRTAGTSGASCGPSTCRSIASRLAGLPGMPAPATPLLCLDTETTGLGSAAGTVAFLIGLGWWEGDRMRLLQLLLPDHSEEGALLDALAAEIPRAPAW